MATADERSEIYRQEIRLMDIHDAALLNLWKALNEYKVRYILVGGIATNLQGFQRYTGDVDIYFDDTSENRQRLRQAYKAYSGLDFASFETIQFIPGWVEFALTNGDKLDIMTSMVGVEANFEECLQMSRQAEIKGIVIPVLHINHLIANKKAVGRPKDQLDVINLEKIRRLRGEEN